MSEINKKAGKYDAVINTQPQTPMYGAVMGGIDGLRNRFESVEDVSQKAKILEEALQYEQEGKNFIIDVFKRENQENLIEEILLKNLSYSEFIINIIFKHQPATILKLSTIETWNELRANNIKFIPNLTGANLSGADLINANLINANLSNANLTGADLSGANLTGANLIWANLTGADLIGANLINANLINANLTSTKLDKNVKIDEKWQLVWDILNNSQLNRNLSGADLSGANLINANLSGADLTGADLTGTDLTGTKKFE